MKKKFFYALFLLKITFSMAQPDPIEDLKKQISLAALDSNKVKMMNIYGRKLTNNNAKDAHDVVMETIDLAKKINYKKG